MVTRSTATRSSAGPMARPRTLFLLAAFAAAALGLLLLAGFMWPDGPNYPRSLNLGSLEQYEAGTATVVRAPDDYDTSRWPNVRTQIAPEVVHQARMWAVRLEDGSIRVLLARDPFDGCTVPWRETFQYEGQEGWFRNPCHGSTYALDGRWVGGASARDMDWFAVEVRPDGDVVVDLTTLHAGETHHGVPADGRPAPNVEGWSARP